MAKYQDCELSLLPENWPGITKLKKLLRDSIDEGTIEFQTFLRGSARGIVNGGSVFELKGLVDSSFSFLDCLEKFAYRFKAAGPFLAFDDPSYFWSISFGMLNISTASIVTMDLEDHPYGYSKIIIWQIISGLELVPFEARRDPFIAIIPDENWMRLDGSISAPWK